MKKYLPHVIVVTTVLGTLFGLYLLSKNATAAKITKFFGFNTTTSS